MEKYLIILMSIIIAVGASVRPTHAISTCEVDVEELELLTKVINSESHGEDYLDKILVASVVLNRMRSNKFPNTMWSVVYQVNQFSGINSKLFRYDPKRTKWDKESYDAALHILQYGPINPNVLYFLNPKISTNERWVTKVMKRRLVHKGRHHYFYE